MPTPVSMFRANDGQLFEKLIDAVNHEQSLFIKDHLTPLFGTLIEASHAPSNKGSHPAESLAIALAGNKELALEFQKVFSKLTLTPTKPVAKKRAAAKKAAKPSAPPPPPSTTEPSPEHLAGLDSLAGTAPIQMPSDEAPPPPQP